MNPEQDKNRALWALVGAIAVMYVVVGALAGYTFNEASQAQHALCAFKGNLEQSVTSGENYLATHHQKVILGVTRATITRSVRTQRHALDSLHDLSC